MCTCCRSEITNKGLADTRRVIKKQITSLQRQRREFKKLRARVARLEERRRPLDLSHWHEEIDGFWARY